MSPTSSLRLTDTGMRRARVRGQWLSGRVPAGRSVHDVVGRLVGVQAQDVTAAGLAIRARSRGLVAADVDAAREDRRIVLTWSLRGTRHLHRAEDVRWLLALLGPTFLRPSKRAEQLGIAGEVGDRAVRVLADALAADGPLTRAQVKDRLAPHGVDPSGQAAIHVIARAAMEGLLCVLPGERYVLLDDWIGPPGAAADVGPGELARRYLAAFGPASVADFAAWSGLGPSAARREWAAIESEMVEVAPSAWLLSADADHAAAAARRRAPTRLVGAFDSLLLAYADRHVHLSPDHAPLVNPGGGMVKPLVVVDGEVAGTWSRTRGRVEVAEFRGSSRPRRPTSPARTGRWPISSGSEPERGNLLGGRRRLRRVRDGGGPMNWRRSGVLAAGLGILAACGGDGSGDRAPAATTIPTVGTTAPTAAPTTAVESGPPAWRLLPPAPIVGRIGAGVVWTGREVIVWGGLPRSGEARFERVGDGAAYDPVAGSWRTIAPAPAGVVGIADRAAAWTGEEAVFWAGNSPDGPAAGAVYNPRTDTWRALPDGPLDIREGFVSAWTGSELVIMGGHGGKSYSDPVAAAVDPRSGSWRVLPSFADLAEFQPAGAFWDGNQVLAAGSVAVCPDRSCPESRPVFFAYDPATDRRREIDLAGVSVAGDDGPRPVGWTGTELVFTTGDGPGPGIVRYDPAAEQWRTGATSSCDRTSSGYGQSAWLADRLLLACGDDQLALYDPTADSWTILDTGPSPLNAKARSQIVWTGTELVVWSGDLRAEGNPTPNDGSVITLRR